MEIRILEDRANPLMKRHEYRFEVSHALGPTPHREEVRGELAKMIRASKDRVIIERMNARFGTAVTRGDANVYETSEAVKLITRDHILVRHGLKEKPTKGPTAPPSTETAPPAPAKTEPVKEASPSAEPAKAESVKEEHAKPEAAKPEHGKGSSPKAEHAKSGKSEHGKDDSGKADHSKAESPKGAKATPASPSKE